MTDPAAVVQAGLRRFARSTNLVLASARVGVVGCGPVADEAIRTVTRIGAQPTRLDGRVPPTIELLIITGTDAGLPEVLAAEAPLLILNLTDQGTDLLAGLPPLPARPGVRGARGQRELFLVTRP